LGKVGHGAVDENNAGEKQELCERRGKRDSNRDLIRNMF
jgi:hypothetical protein